jgi:hypothetical protein
MTSFDFLEFFDLGVYKWMDMKFIYFLIFYLKRSKTIKFILKRLNLNSNRPIKK